MDEVISPETFELPLAAVPDTWIWHMFENEALRARDSRLSRRLANIAYTRNRDQWGNLVNNVDTLQVDHQRVRVEFQGVAWLGLEFRVASATRPRPRAQPKPDLALRC